MAIDRTALAAALLDLEALLRRTGLWTSEHPGLEALASEMPFAVDTLAFEAWLQFIFIPKLQELLHTGAPLPLACQIAPAAEVAFMGRPEGSALLAALQQLDAIFAGEQIPPRAESQH